MSVQAEIFFEDKETGIKLAKEGWNLVVYKEGVSEPTDVIKCFFEGNEKIKPIAPGGVSKGKYLLYPGGPVVDVLSVEGRTDALRGFRVVVSVADGKILKMGRFY
ncbi:MAG: hypothetical protein DRJ31_03570 [Candidatus Methanomethylicota archaeon]|uniref:Uncharacterized protein n=1 Tax=Thermoproteota archaeon TaxID=2056631 RepID=A0A497ER45_9CREN|nr:MAG: hypothetical protein DRJ31_03570 [Candidatus Verstraetearchaeota archaeon]